MKTLTEGQGPDLARPTPQRAYRLVVFPNDPIYKYYQKGEIKAGYWNPGNMFAEVHLISLADGEVEAEKVSSLAGDGQLFIHAIGRPSYGELLRLGKYRDKVLALVAQINPHLIRAHNPSLHGWLATQCARKLVIPSIISLHADYSRCHNFRILGLGYFPRFIRSVAERLLFESHALGHADRILPAYAFPARYARSFRQAGIEVIYNKVFSDKFGSGEKKRNGRFSILSVGRHIPGKNPEPLIRAIEHLDVELVLIGTGPLTNRAKQVVQQLGIGEKVRFIDAVPNESIHEYYQAADVFAIAIEYPGICIPVLEAMAASLPIVVPKPLWEDEPELLGSDAAVVVENSPWGFRDAFAKLMEDSELRQQLGTKAREKFAAVEGGIMERREAQLFHELIEGAPKGP